MTRGIDPAFAAVDWGTSHLRIWIIGQDGAVVAGRKSDDGMASTPSGMFENVLERHLAQMDAPQDMPVVMCGMVGARQGWQEAEYVSIPASLDTIATHALRVKTAGRDVRILPGMSRIDDVAPDVMRGEETQLLGLSRIADSSTADEKIVCMPGTHSKWVRLEGRQVVDFRTFMTGDVFAALCGATVLRHSVGTEPIDPGDADFRDAVQASLDSPADLLNRLFSIRPAGLLSGLSPAAASARLSGYLIGQEIAGARDGLSSNGEVELVGGNALSRLYRSALSVAGIGCTVRDGEKLVIAGLAEAASLIWNLETAQAG